MYSYIKQLLKGFWNNETFWKWYCRAVPILAVITFIIFWVFWFEWKSRGLIQFQSLEEFGLSLK